jgi:hypothetical protein
MGSAYLGGRESGCYDYAMPVRSLGPCVSRVALGLGLGLVFGAGCVRRMDDPARATTTSGAAASAASILAAPLPLSAGAGGSSAPANAPAPAPPAPAAPPPSEGLRELPLGGRTIFPTHRLVGFCGTPGGAPTLGRLSGDLGAQAKAIQQYAAKYAGDRKPLAVFELIAVVVQGFPGADGKWRRRVPDSVVDEYLKAAREAKALLLLNIQPGQADFLGEVKHFEKYLKEPDVGVALDPEWAVRPKQRPGSVYGQVNGQTLNDVADYVASIVKESNLPEKVMVFHQVNGYVLKDEGELKAHDGVAIIKSVDGLGPKGAKITTYALLVKTTPAGVHAGFKLFFDEDTNHGHRLMTPDEVLGLNPVPEYVMYE